MASQMSEARKRANLKWDATNLKRLSLAMPIAVYERMEAFTTEHKESKNGFIVAAVRDRLETNGENIPDEHDDDYLKIRLRKDTKLYRRIEAAASKKGVDVRSYVTDAIKAVLAVDEI